MATGTVMAEGLMFPEGPAIDAQGVLHVVEIAGQRVSKVLDDGSVELFAETGGGPNGSAFGPDGHLYVCNNGGRWPGDVPSTAGAPTPPEDAGSIQRIAPDGTVETVVREVDGVPLDAPNDICFDDHGGYYFTDPVWSAKAMERTPGNLVYCDAAGDARRVHTGIQFPNGLGVTDDGRFLIVCESMTGMMLGFKIEEPGRLAAEPKPTGQIGRRSVPDGFCFDDAGHMIIAGHQTDSLFVLDAADGRPVEVIRLEHRGPTNVCFGGPDFSTMYVTSSDTGRIVTVEWRHRGMRLHPDRG